MMSPGLTMDGPCPVNLGCQQHPAMVQSPGPCWRSGELCSMHLLLNHTLAEGGRVCARGSPFWLKMCGELEVQAQLLRKMHPS